MARRRYSDEFKIEAVKQVLENGYTIIVISHTLGHMKDGSILQPLLIFIVEK